MSTRLWNLGRASDECGLAVYTLNHLCRNDVALSRAWRARKVGKLWYVDAARFSAWLDASANTAIITRAESRR